ncbi:hypothetical protein FQR65_LT09407 [Abscondita terminalis]|nr:hypothetical protein FQR65_LT09407 [Abscondita terminalis]
MKKLARSADTGDADSDQDGDPEQLLDEWLGELDNLTEGLDSVSSSGQLRPLNVEISAPRIDSYRFSMANLEDSQDVDLDAILGELCALESQCEREIGNARDKRISDVPKQTHQSRTHARSCSEGPRLKLDPGESDLMLKTDSIRTDSPDNDSAFSDTVSMLSSESSASSGGSGPKSQTLQSSALQTGQDEASRAKSEKIRMAMEKIKEANIQKLFVKVFTVDGSAKSLLVDEKMICAYVTRLLADKNHVQMDPKWAIVEHLPDLYMERVYEDHELLVENLMLWTRDSKNKIYFAERPDKTQLFSQPEKFLISLSDKCDNVDYDEHSRNMLVEEFFSSTSQTIPQVEGPLYLKSDSKKGWKKYHFVLRASGLYYFQKEKPKTTRDLICLTTFDVNQVYCGLGWKKKYKAPTDYCFAIKHPRLQEPKSSKYIKYLCAEDMEILDRWINGIRIAKYGRRLMDNYRILMDDLAQDDLDKLAHARSCSVSSIAVQSNVTTPTQNNSTILGSSQDVLPRAEFFRYSGSEGYGTQSDTYSAPSEASFGRHSRASSSSSSGCMSDGALSSCENAFESEFPMGTIKRKPSMKPSLPLTNITRQLKEVGETREENETLLLSSPVSYTNSGTLTRLHNRRKSSNSTDDGSSNGTLKRQQSYKSRGSIESVGGRGGNSSPLCGTPVRERSSPFGDRDKLSPYNERPPSSNAIRNCAEMPSSMMDSITSLPPPPDSSDDISLTDLPSYQLPPPPPEVYNSNLSLDSLPPPPNPSDLPSLTGSELTGSQLSLMSLPPPPSENGDTDTIRRRKGSTTPTNALSPDRTPTQGMSPDLTPTHSRVNTPCFSPPPLSIGSNNSTPTRCNPPAGFDNGQITDTYAINSQNIINGQNYDRYQNNQIPNQPPAYMNPPPYRQMSTLPQNSTNFNSSNGLRSSLRQSSLPRQTSINSIASSNSSSSSGGTIYSISPHVIDLHKKNTNSPQLQRKVNFQELPSPKKSAQKKISFNLIPQEAPALPKKPPPPVRSENTKLSSPKKLVEPPTDFLKDLQRVMRKKWQVAQKCKLEPATTPHEVLGFRDPVPLLPEYKESNVSRWVKEHYGCNNLYENIYPDHSNAVVEYACSPLHGPKDINRNKRPPPPPPKRSETTQLKHKTIHALIINLTNQHELISQKFLELKRNTSSKISTNENDVNILKLLKQSKFRIQSIFTKSENLISFRKHKRSPFNFIGKVSKWLFGTMDDDERQEIYNAINSLTSNQNNIIDNVNSKITLLQNMFTQLKLITNKTNENMLSIETYLNSINHEILNFNQYIIILETVDILENNINEVDTFINELQQSIILGFRNQLHPFLLRYSQISEELNHLRSLYPNGILKLINEHYYYSILSVKIGLDTANIIISIEFPIVEDNNSTLYKIVKVPYQNTYILEQCDYLVWSYNKLACVTDYFLIENKYIVKNSNNLKNNNNNCINNIVRNNVKNCTIIQVEQSTTQLEALSDANYLLITNKLNLLKYQCQTKGTVKISQNSLIQLPVNCSIEFNNQMYISAKDEMFKEMKLPELSEIKFENIVINDKPFELTKINLEDNFEKQLMQDQLIHPMEKHLQFNFPYYRISIFVVIIVIFVLYKFRIKVCPNKVKKTEDSFLTRHGGVTSEESADQTLLAQTSAVTGDIIE